MVTSKARAQATPLEQSLNGSAEDIQFRDAPPSQLTSADLMQNHGNTIARLISGNARVSSMEVKVFISTERKIVCRASVDGKSAFVKYFQHCDHGAPLAFRREFSTLRLLYKSGLAPRPLHAHPDELFIISEDVDGIPLSDPDGLTAENLPTIADMLGRWAGAFSKAVPQFLVDDTWLNYLTHCPELRDHPALEDFSEFLGGLKITNTSLARNDCALSNFILKPDGTLSGLDFERSQMKPMGWDLLQLARVLTRRFPTQIDAIVASLIAGFSREVDIDTDAFASLLKIFIAASAFQQLSGISIEQEALAHYNRTAPDPAGFALKTPCNPGKPTIMAMKNADKLMQHIGAVVTQCWADQPTVRKPAGEEDNPASTPDATGMLAAACANCQGWCCINGAEKNAHIDKTTITRVREHHPDWTADQLISFYAQKLPVRHTKDSCLYLGAEGCSLPSFARSDTCNSHQCGALTKLADRIARTKDIDLLSVAVENGNIRQAVRITPGLTTPVDLDAIAWPSGREKQTGEGH